MKALEAIKLSFRVVNKNLILAQPLILFLLIISLFSGGFSYLKGSFYAFIIFLVSFVMLVISFVAGWLNMTQKTIDFELIDNTDDEEKAVKSFGLVKHFFPGVGEYFLPVLLLGLIYGVLTLLFSYVSLKLGVKLIGAPDIDIDKLNAVSASSAELHQYLSSLPLDKLTSIAKWFSYITVSGMIFQFFTLWWVPALFYNSKNAFKALWISLKFLFKRFAGTVGVFFFLLSFNFVVSLINSVFSQNIWLSLVAFLVFFYFATYAIVLIFLYYGKNQEN